MGYDVVPHAVADVGAAHQCGYAGHLSDAAHCLFHLNTRVGDYRISTVGNWHPDIAGVLSLEDAVPAHDPPAHLGGAHWLGRGDPMTYFETVVLPVKGPGINGEGEATAGTELVRRRYETAEQAERGHWGMVVEYGEMVRQANREQAELMRRLKE